MHECLLINFQKENTKKHGFTPLPITKTQGNVNDVDPHVHTTRGPHNHLCSFQYGKPIDKDVELDVKEKTFDEKYN